MLARANFLLYGDLGLAGKDTLINIFQDTLALEYADYSLAKYSVEWQPDDKHLLRVGNPRFFDHPYQSPQLPLWPPGSVEWFVILKCETPQRRRRRKQAMILQLSFLFELDGTQG